VVFVRESIQTGTMKRLNYLFPAVLLVAGLISCHRIVSLPDEPRVEYTSFAVFDTTDILGNSYKGGRLKFYFEDGDGDLGLPQPSGEEGSDTINLYLTLYKKSNGSMIPASPGDILFTKGYRIPYIDRPGQNKILKGTIAVSFLYQFYNTDDSTIIKYNFYVRDRANNISNTETTPEIPVSVNGTY